MKHSNTMLYPFIFAMILSACSDNSSQNAVQTDPEQENAFAGAEANPGIWSWIPVDESICRDGTATGIGVRLQPNATNLLVYMQGGGACYDAASCQSNEEGNIAGARYGFEDFNAWVGTLGNQGIFNSSNLENRMHDWNTVYIPYCSGDLHAGNRVNAEIDDVEGVQQFQGYNNTTKFLDLIAPYFAGTDQLLLAGSSAGGHGVTLNYEQFAARFPSIDVTALIDSSALIVDEAVNLSCFESKVINTFDPPALLNCPECSDVNLGGYVNVYPYLSQRFPAARFAAYSADADLAGVLLLNNESLACGGGGVNPINYRFGLLRLRDSLLIPAGNWSTMFTSGIQHTFTGSDTGYFDESAGGSTVAQWVSSVLDGDVLHLAP